MKYAQIINGNVVNVFLWNGEDNLDVDGELVDVTDETVGPGYTYDGTTFTAPPEPESDYA